MTNLTLNPQEIQKWFRDKGDETHNLNYELNEDSVVIDLGGYTGVWGQQIINKYNPNLYIIEPVPSFFNGMVNKFSDNDKVRLLNVGVLIQINIEGDEYPLLESMLETGSINKFKNIQVQFHLGIKDDINRRNKIREGLVNNGFKIKFEYAFVWESWTKI